MSWGLTRRCGGAEGAGALPVDSALRAREPAYGNFLLLEGGGYRLPRGGEAGSLHSMGYAVFPGPLVPWSITNPYSSAPRTSGTRWWLSEGRDRRNYKGSTASRSPGGPQESCSRRRSPPGIDSCNCQLLTLLSGKYLRSHLL